MLRSSLGFHTLTLSYPLFFQEAQQLISDFTRYSKETGAIQMYPDHGNLRIKFLNRAVGIEWLIRSNIYQDTVRKLASVV